MTIKQTGMLKHASYIIWSAKAVRLANREWRAGRGRGDELMTAGGLDLWLFRWAVDAGRIEDPGPRRVQPLGAYVAVVFDEDRRAVVQEARNYWRKLVEEQA